MWQTRITVQGSDKLAQVAKALKPDARLLAEIGNKFAVLVKQQFVTGTDPYEKPWVKNAPSTVKRKKSSKPLIDTSELQKSLVVRPTDSTISLELSRRYPSGTTAAIHQTGSGFLPKRQIVPEKNLPPKWLKIVETAFLSRLNAIN